ncbi:ABC transporter ATP-binding protein [Sphingomonas qomolangmaensis]|uniref:ABC transporter ATP-binding protein/permease n=1 Tax=Sphingomonas qomolangmaensis TaxID=2918765 RepID=A0ABY5LCP6_9SPHN|nr:ABC transporter ATP-binding protein [Sphingomonas qomolangmaensis]UUL82471.1 ABC transporter ATP-binding protein/permease [Sphingomonas qomolangmaensis]
MTPTNQNSAPGPWRSARKLYVALPQNRRRQAALTIVLMIVGAFAELATIGAVLPFLAIVTGGSQGRYGGAVAIVDSLAATTGLGTLGFSALLLVAIAILSGAVRLALVRTSQSFVFSVAHDLATQIYDRTLHQPYSYHVMRNSSQTISGIEKVQYVLGNVLLPAMLGTTAAVVGLFILAALIAIDPATSLVACLCFVILYAIVSLATRKRLYRNADIIGDALQERVQTLQEGMGGIRDVLLDRTQPIFVAKFARVDHAFRRAQAANQFIAAAPRYVVEAGGVVLIAVLTLYVSTQPGGIVAALPMLGALALGAQRLLPLVQQVYFSWSQIHGNRRAIEDVARLLDIPPPVPEAAIPVPPLAIALEFDRVTYRYPSGDRPAIDSLSLTIPRGARIGLVGKSGGGKSTLADLLMGLLDPTTGCLRVDGRVLDAAAKPSWQAQIAHVPQAIYLADSSIAANIAFGRDAEAIDMARVRTAAQGADLHDFIAGLPDGYQSRVGERGIRLSGGQRQRIGIARALYKQATILILDEATSALDDETERAVMAAIDRLSRDLTIVSIAHRVSTLRGCDLVVRIEGGRIVAQGPYAHIVTAAAAAG